MVYQHITHIIQFNTEIKVNSTKIPRYFLTFKSLSECHIKLITQNCTILKLRIKFRLLFVKSKTVNHSIQQNNKIFAHGLLQLYCRILNSADRLFVNVECENSFLNEFKSEMKIFSSGEHFNLSVYNITFNITHFQIC